MASVALERSWRSALRILLLCMLALLPSTTADRGMLVGGWLDRSVSDPDVQNAVAFAVEAYNRRSNSVYYNRALEVRKAQSQVVEGVKYFLIVLLVNTECDKRIRAGLTHAELERCAVPSNAQQQKRMCKFYVWSRPWLNDTRLTSMSCGEAHS